MSDDVISTIHPPRVTHDVISAPKCPLVLKNVDSMCLNQFLFFKIVFFFFSLSKTEFSGISQK